MFDETLLRKIIGRKISANMLIRKRKRYTKPLPSITKKTEREKEALRMKETNPKKKK
jgi:hypothetical protein